MRVLFTTVPVKTHFYPMVPLATALRAAGHEVLVACQPAFVPAVTATGLPATAVGRDRDPFRLMDRDLLVGEEEDCQDEDIAWEERPEAVDWDELVEHYATAIDDWHRPDNFPIARDLINLAKSWRPDLVVWEPITYAGALAAKSCGAAHARLMNNADTLGCSRQHFLKLADGRPATGARDPFADWLGPYLREVGSGFTEDLVTGHFTIDHFPDRLVDKADLDYLPMRWVPFGGAGRIPEWLARPPESPRVAITLGQFAADHFDGYDIDPYEIIDAVTGLGVEAVVTIPESHQQRRSVPADVRVVPWVPIEPLLRTCAGIVHHGGSSTLITALALGLPQLLLTWPLTETQLAARLGQVGAAIVTPARRADAAMIRDGVQRLLTDGSITTAARNLAAEMAAQPSPAQVVPHLVELTRKYR